MAQSLQRKLDPRLAYPLGISAGAFLAIFAAFIFAPSPHIRTEMGEGLATWVISLVAIGSLLMLHARSYRVWWDAQSIHMTPPSVKSMLGLQPPTSLRLTDVRLVSAYEPRGLAGRGILSGIILEGPPQLDNEILIDFYCLKRAGVGDLLASIMRVNPTVIVDDAALELTQLS